MTSATTDAADPPKGSQESPSLVAFGVVAVAELALLAYAFRGGQVAPVWKASAAQLPLSELGSWAPSVIALAVAQVGLVVATRRAYARFQQTWVFFLAAVVSITLTAALLPGGLPRLGQHIADPRAVSVYYDAVVAEDFSGLLDNLPAEARKYADRTVAEEDLKLHNHSATRPPGFLILFRPFRAFGSFGPHLAAWLVIAIYAAGVFPLRRLLGEGDGEPLALYAYLLIPSVQTAAPGLDLIYPTVVLCVVLALIRGLDQRSTPWIVASSLGFGSMLCLSYVPLIWFAVLVTPVLMRYRRERLSFFLSRGALFLVLAALPHLGMSLFFPWDPLELFRACQSTSKMIEGAMARGYLEWFFLNLWEQAVVLGLPLLYLVFRRIKRPEREALICLIVAVALINISGLTRGETARIWIFLTPLLAWSLGRQEVERNDRLWLGLHALHLAAVCVAEHRA